LSLPDSFTVSLIRDAEECRELEPRQEISPAEVDSFAVARSRATVKEKAASAAFLFFSAS
jgi:hypothetical protein